MTTLASTDDRADRSHDPFWRDCAAIFGASLRTFVSVWPYLLAYVLCSTAVHWIADQLPVKESVAAMSVARVLGWLPTLLLAVLLTKCFSTMLAATEPRARSGLRSFGIAVGKSVVLICAAQIIARTMFNPIATFVTHPSLFRDLMFPAYTVLEPLSYYLTVVVVFAFVGTWLAADVAGRKPALSEAVRRGEKGFAWTASRLLVAVGSVTVVFYLLAWGALFVLASVLVNSNVGQFKYVFLAATYLLNAYVLVLAAVCAAQAYTKSEADRVALP